MRVRYSFVTQPVCLAFLLAWCAASMAEPVDVVVGGYQYCGENMRYSLSDSRLQDHGDGTVTDTVTGLMWMQCSLGQSGTDCATGSVSKHHWQSALEAAEAHSFAGHNDWRLPNVTELQSVVETACQSPATNINRFPGAQSAMYWTSTPYSYHYAAAWQLDFDTGFMRPDLKTAQVLVRLVRSP